MNSLIQHLDGELYNQTTSQTSSYPESVISKASTVQTIDHGDIWELILDLCEVVFVVVATTLLISLQ